MFLQRGLLYSVFCSAGGSSDSSGFEMVTGGQKKLEQVDKPIQEGIFKPFKAEPLEQNTENLSETQKLLDKSILSDVSSTKIKEESGLTDYIPHISVGVAAAAACIGFLMLRKNT